MANKLQQLWSELSDASNTIKDASDAMIMATLDTVLRSKAAELAMGVVMLANNTSSMFKNTKGRYPANTNKATGTLLDTIISGNQEIYSLMPTAVTLINQAMVEPNIAGIPISSSKVETDKNVEISEQAVIIQSKGSKQYWTDNAVPRLKEWTITGYLTSFTPLDTGLIIKPSLVWQAYFLSKCADSRRPLLFKTNRNEFVKVQIMNLHTVEEASYNNAIEVSITLKEYNPYVVATSTGEQDQAIYQGERSA